MEPKFNVGDIVKTSTGTLATVIPLTGLPIFRESVQVRTLEGKEYIFDARNLTKTHLKDGTAAYAQEGYKAPTSDALKYKLFGHTEYFSAMEKSIQETYSAPPQPIFRLKHNNGSSGWEGCHFVLVAEDEHELLVKEVDINEARVRDRVMTLQKSNWTRDYSIGDEIINFLSARGGNFTNKLVDKS